jgi:hypothetical protein
MGFVPPVHRQLPSGRMCPQGLTIPHDINRSGVLFINRTISDCALSCMYRPNLTAYDAILRSWAVADFCTACCSLLVLILWWIDDKKKNHIFVISLGVVLFCSSAFRLASYYFSQDRVCLDSTTPSTGYTMCGFEGLVFTSTLLFLSVNFGLHSWEAFRCIVLKQSRKMNRRLYGGIMVGVTALLAAGGLVTRSFGSEIGIPMCALRRQSAAFLFLVLGFMLICSILGIVFCANIVVKALAVHLQSDSESLWALAKLAGVPLKFVVFTGFFLLSIIAARIWVQKCSENHIPLMLEWGACALQHYDGASYSSYEAECGSEPEVVSLSVLAMYQVWIRGGLGLFFLVVNAEGVASGIGKYFGSIPIAPQYSEQTPSPLATSDEVDVLGRHSSSRAPGGGGYGCSRKHSESASGDSGRADYGSFPQVSGGSDGSEGDLTLMLRLTALAHSGQMDVLSH